MNRIVTLITCLIALLPTAALAADADAKLDAVRAKVSAMFEAIEPEDVSPSQVDGWFLIQKGSVVAYISDDGRYLMQGELIDLDQQINLTEQSRSGSRRELMASVADEQTILFAPENPEHTVTVFTDVDCSYCRKLHARIDEYMDQGIAIRYVLYPRNGPASSGWSRSEDVWCARDRNNALTMAKLDREFETASCDASIISKHYVLGQDVGLNGTPAIVLEDGRLIGGYVAPASLKARITANSQ
ncbi:MAG: DsbC family protein [Gammaproteobacteria bacterium]|nr:DsbC family protein [Gammaproteobacteria bacterium]